MEIKITIKDLAMDGKAIMTIGLPLPEDKPDPRRIGVEKALFTALQVGPVCRAGHIFVFPPLTRKEQKVVFGLLAAVRAGEDPEDPLIRARVGAVTLLGTRTVLI